MANCLLLQAEEATWAGDKSAEGRLKGLITSSFQMIESKGFDPIKMPNYLRCIMTSNEDWVVPAGKDERRFVVLDVHPRCAQNHEYFAEMLEELNGGGRQRLLFDLLNFELSSINLRKIPRTKALLQQKLLSFDSIDRFWFSRLSDGTPLRSSSQWELRVPTTALFNEYVSSSMEIGDRRRVAHAQFGERMARLRLQKVRPAASQAGEGRPYYYELPSLEECREVFAQHLGQTIDWPTVHDDPTEDNDQVPQ